MTPKEFEAIRKRNKIPCEDLAVLLGVRTQTVNNWRKGRRGISKMVGRFMLMIDHYPQVVRHLRKII